MRTKNPLVLIGILLLLICINGCVRYDLGINFETQQGGTIVQDIKLGKQLTSFSEGEANQLLNIIETRAKSLQGNIKRISSSEAIVTIPFSNGQELQSKFNKFFNSYHETGTLDAIDLLNINARMSLRQSNLLLLERNKLDLTVDLTSLGVVSEQGNLIVSPGSLIQIEFRLNTPWLARTIMLENPSGSIVRSEGNQLIWDLVAGKYNHIQAVFWVPSLLGLGAIVIVILMLAGFYLKYKKLPLVA